MALVLTVYSSAFISSEEGSSDKGSFTPAAVVLAVLSSSVFSSIDGLSDKISISMNTSATRLVLSVLFFSSRTTDGKFSSSDKVALKCPFQWTLQWPWH